MPKEPRERVYYASAEKGNTGWTAPVGTVAQVFFDAVENAKRGRAEEQESVFVPFWEWRLQRAEDELRLQQEDLKEEVWD
jgi:hypothetical protein